MGYTWNMSDCATWNTSGENRFNAQTRDITCFQRVCSGLLFSIGGSRLFVMLLVCMLLWGREDQRCHSAIMYLEWNEEDCKIKL